MSSTDAIGSSKPKYPFQDDATSVADASGQKVTPDGLKTTKDSWEGWQKQNGVLENLEKAGDFVVSYGKLVGGLFAPSTLKKENPFTFLKAWPSVGGVPLPPIAAGVVGLSKMSADVTAAAAKDGDKLRQVIHNEYAQITVNKYLLDKGLISQKQFDAAVTKMSPGAKQFAYGTSSLDDRVAEYKKLAAESGADKAIALELKQGKSAAVHFGVTTQPQLEKAMKDPEFKKAYEENAAFRAGVDAMIDEFANDKAKYEQDVKTLSLPAPPPVKG